MSRNRSDVFYTHQLANTFTVTINSSFPAAFRSANVEPGTFGRWALRALSGLDGRTPVGWWGGSGTGSSSGYPQAFNAANGETNFTPEVLLGPYADEYLERYRLPNFDQVLAVPRNEGNFIGRTWFIRRDDIRRTAPATVITTHSPTRILARGWGGGFRSGFGFFGPVDNFTGCYLFGNRFVYTANPNFFYDAETSGPEVLTSSRTTSEISIRQPGASQRNTLFTWSRGRVTIYEHIVSTLYCPALISFPIFGDVLWTGGGEYIEATASVGRVKKGQTGRRFKLRTGSHSHSGYQSNQPTTDVNINEYHWFEWYPMREETIDTGINPGTARREAETTTMTETDEKEDKEDQVKLDIPDINRASLVNDLENTATELRKQLISQRINNTNPEYVTFDKADLIKTNLTMDDVGTVVINRGIFILPSETDTPVLPGDSIAPLSADAKNFSLCIANYHAFRTGGLYNGYLDVPFPVNIGESYCRWTTLGVSKNTNLKIPYTSSNEQPINVIYSDGSTGASVAGFPHPLDSVYVSGISNDPDDNTRMVLSFRHLTPHTIFRFFEVQIAPDNYYLDHWSTLLGHGPAVWTVDVQAQPSVRSKDMYSTEGVFKDYEGIKEIAIPEGYERYTLEDSLLPNVEYTGMASNVLRLFPTLQTQHTTTVTDGHQWPKIDYRKSSRDGGAYYVSAIYPEQNYGNYDISTRTNRNAYSAQVRGSSFVGYYHHDMYNVNDQHLRPTTWVHAAIKGAGMTPAFHQQGTTGVDGDINSYKMQSIMDTEATYRDLITRVLPALGYIIRLNAATNQIELVDIASRQWPTYEMGDNMIQLVGTEYDTGRQYSSFIFENEDMIRGENTLDEFQDDPLQSGRYYVYNSNPFIQGRTHTIKTGTWTCPFDRIATFLSLRTDRYIWRVTNFHLLDTSGNLSGPHVGDRVRLKSVKIPNESDQIDCLVMQRTQNEEYTEYHGLAFEGA